MVTNVDGTFRTEAQAMTFREVRRIIDCLEKIADGFTQAHAEESDWTLKDFGFCLKCKDFTETASADLNTFYRETFGHDMDPDDCNCNDNRVTFRCSGCKTLFIYQAAYYGSKSEFPRGYLVSGDPKLTDKQKKRLAKLNCKPSQRKYFKEALAEVRTEVLSLNQSSAQVRGLIAQIEALESMRLW